MTIKEMIMQIVLSNIITQVTSVWPLERAKMTLLTSPPVNSPLGRGTQGAEWQEAGSSSKEGQERAGAAGLRVLEHGPSQQPHRPCPVPPSANIPTTVFVPLQIMSLRIPYLIESHGVIPLLRRINQHLKVCLDLL